MDEEIKFIEKKKKSNMELGGSTDRSNENRSEMNL